MGFHLQIIQHLVVKTMITRLKLKMAAKLIFHLQKSVSDTQGKTD